jgi:AraC family transcriptional regulator of adaptative response/methylated-DNA-[protein]-cysteine methyltransferase
MARKTALRPEIRGSEDPQREEVLQACRLIEENLEQPLTLADLGDAVGLSPAHFQRLFKRLLGITPRQYADACRLGRLKERLRERRTVTMAMLEAGYGSSSRLYERSSSQLGMTPNTYRKGGPATHIGFTIVDSPLGRLLLAATDKGLCRLSMGDADRELEADLRREFPKAELERDDERLGVWVAEVLSHLRGEQPHLELPLDVRATAFQWRVWQELMRIPYGSTRSYSEVARALGKPSAARAVARACATNPVAVVVPCHRVVRENGDLGGYGWGLGRKRLLLEQEKSNRGGEETE